MSISLIRNRALAGMIALLAVNLQAAPRIAVDLDAYEAGTVREEAGQFIKHSFTVSNTGTDTLRISGVRVSCGCTVVEYDSIIPAGKKGTITPQVDLKGMQAGRYNKSVTVMSNDPENPSLQLMISYSYLTSINIVPNFIYWAGKDSASDTSEVSLVFSTEKKDLVLKGVTFKPDSATHTGARPPISAVTILSQKRADSLNSSKAWDYAVQLRGVIHYQSIGELVFETNHPKKKQAGVRATVSPVIMPYGAMYRSGRR